MSFRELLDAARVSFDAGNYDGCVDPACLAYAQAGDDGERADAARWAARGMMSKELHADAIVWCDRALAAVPGDAAALAARGISHFQLGRTAEAVADVEAAAAIAGAPAIVHHQRAMVLRGAGRGDDAYASLARIVDDAERGRLALRVRGMWRLDDGNRNEGLADLAVAAARGDTAAIRRLRDDDALDDDGDRGLTLVIALYEDDDLDGSAAALDALLARTIPDRLRVRALCERARVANWTRDFAGALACSEQAVQLAPDDPEVLTVLGRAQFNESQDEVAAQTLARALAAGASDSTVESHLGDLHAFAKRHAEAAEWYARCLARSPRRAPVMRKRGHELEMAGDADGARAQYLEAAIAADGDAIQWCRDHDVELPQSLFDNGNTGLTYGGEPMAIASTLRRAAELWLAHSRAPGDFCARHAAMASSNQGFALHRAGEHAAAEAALRRAVELRPAFRDAWNHLGNTLAIAGRLEEAIAAFDRAAWCDPSFASADYGKGDALRRLGRAAECIAALEKARAIGYAEQRMQNDIHFRLARAYQALEGWDDARVEYQTVADATGDDTDVARVDSIDFIATTAALGTDGHAKPPYRRYGMAPSAWSRNGEIAVRLQLTAAPDEATRIAVARAAQAALAEVGEMKPWLWSERFGYLAIAADADDPLPDAFEVVQAAVEAIHAVAPLVEAVGLSAVGPTPDDDAETWSIADRPVPDDGPEFPRHVAFWVSQFGDTTAWPAPAVDPAVERALHELRGEQARAAAEVWIADARAHRDAGELVVVPIDDQPPVEEAASDAGPDLGDRVGPDDYARIAAGGGVIVRRHEGYYTGIDRVTAGGEVHTVVAVDGDDPLLMRHIDAVSVSSDGRWAVYATRLQRELYRIEIASGAVVLLDETSRKIGSTAFLDGDHLMVKTDDELRVYAIAGERATVVASNAADLGPSTAWSGGKLFLSGQLDQPSIVITGWCDGVLARLAEISAPINMYSIWIAGGRAFARGDFTVEIVNLDAAWSRFAAWVRGRAAERAAMSGLLLEQLALAPSPGIGDGPVVVREGAAWHVMGAAGLAFALVANEDEDEGGYLARAGDGDGVHAIEPPLAAPSFVYDWRDDGKAVLATAEGVLYEIDLAARTSRSIAEGVDRACYIRGGHAAIEAGELALYRWSKGAPELLGRVAIDEEVGDLVATAGGTGLVVAAGERTLCLALDGGAVRVLGAIEQSGWFAMWNRGGVTYLQRGNGAAKPPTRYRLVGAADAIAAAEDTASATESIEVAEAPAMGDWETSDYPGMTWWATGGLDADADDDDEDADADDEDEDEDDADADDDADDDDDDEDEDDDDKNN